MTLPLADILNAQTIAEQPIPVRGTGGGLADAVPATIDGEQPAALSEGEFVIPADVVSMLGDGSSEAGARILQGIIEKVRGTKQKGDTEQARDITSLLSE